MGLEIERRFIVKGNQWKSYIDKIKEIKQGYLISKIDEWTVRVRIINQKESWLTLKYPHNELSRHEFEYLIPIDDSHSLMELATNTVTKTRFELTLKEGSWIVDCFHEKNAPLVLAEVELNSTEQVIDPPNWCQQEVTGLPEFSNASLAKSPISEWTIDKRRLIL